MSQPRSRPACARRTLRAVTMALLLLLLVACANQTPPEEPEELVEVATATAVPTDLPAPTDTAVPPPPTDPPPTEPPAATATAEPEPTNTLSPIRATAQALAQAVTIPTATPTPEGVSPDNYLGQLNFACTIIQENYVRDDFNGIDWPAVCEAYRPLAEAITDQADFWDLMTDFVAELGDEHSRFVPPDRFGAEFGVAVGEASGTPWTGLQLSRSREDEVLRIWYVCETGPAAQAGLQRGDHVLAIDGVSLVTADGRPDYDTAIDLLFGDEAAVTLTVQQGPDESPRDVTLQKGGAAGCDGWRVAIASEEPYVGYVRAPSFGNVSDENILQAIEILEEQGELDGLILDIRHNGGGNSDRDLAIFTEGTFGTVGPLREGSTRAIFRIRGPIKWNDTTPLVVLTDGGSASASEYFATGIQQSGRGVLVGMPTAGNTEGINSFGLSDGSVIRLAWTTLVLPDGRSLEGVGVVPDVAVPLGEWGLQQQPDAQLDAAIETILDLIDSQG